MERSFLYRVALEVDMEDLPSDVQIAITGALVSGLMGVTPGLLCVVSYVINDHMANSCWSMVHGFLNADLEQFEREFLPFVLDRAETCAVRVRMKEKGLERWMWWPGSSVEELFLSLSAALVMET